METVGGHVNEQDNDDAIYVAVGKDVEESRPNMVWAICNARGRKICILHIHIPAKKIFRFPAAFLFSETVKEHRLREYNQIERQKIHRILEEYALMCEQVGIRAEKLYAEWDSIESGIVELISRHGISMLVMGAASNTLSARIMKELKSRKARYVRAKAPAFCHIWFVFKGQLVYTRSRSGGTIGEVSPALHLASPNTESGQSSCSRSDHVIEEQIDQQSTAKLTECIRGVSGNDGIKLDAEAAEKLSPHRNPGAERSTDGSDGILRRTFSGDTYFSTRSPSEREDDSPSISFLNIQRKIDEAHDCSSPPSFTEWSTNHDVYDKLKKYAFEIEKFKQEAFEESIRYSKAEKETIAEKRRSVTFQTMYFQVFKQNRKFQEDHSRVREEGEKVKSHLKEVMENLQASQEQNFSLHCRVEDTNKIVRDLVQKDLSASGLLEKYEKQKDELQVELENALKVAHELKKQAEDRSHATMPRYFVEISFPELQEATRNFSPVLKIRDDDYACTYKGMLWNTEVAIKMLHRYRSRGISKFHEEVNMLSRLRHPNLVALIGVCPEAWTLIYEYFPNGSLEDRMSCKDNTPPLTWKRRIQIAADLCSVLMFLHSSTPNPVVYGDLRTSNILLDANYIAKLSDHGIFRPRDDAHDFAYVDPEFIAAGELTPHSNVYSLGIILLRLLTGRPVSGLSNRVQKALDEVKLKDLLDSTAGDWLLTGRPVSELINRVQNALDEGKLKDLLDSTAGDWPFVQANQLAHLAMSCCDMKPWRRPDLASEVWRVLEPMTASGRIPAFQLGSGDNRESRQTPSSFICPIYQEVMEDPVIASDGFSYEAEAIKAWFNGGHATSPMTNLRLPHCNLVPNHPLRSAIQAWLQH